MDALYTILEIAAYFAVAYVALEAFDYARARVSGFRRGGLYFWRIGRLGGSVYLARR